MRPNATLKAALLSLLLLLLPHTALAAAQEHPASAASKLIAQGKFQQAETYLREQLPQFPPNNRAPLLYLLGLSLSGQHQYAQAAEVFRTVLDKAPRNTRVRNALGRVLFLSGDDEAARIQFDLVLADKTADTRLHQLARQHLAAIRARNGWTYSSAFRISENSNANNAPESDAVVYIAGLPFSSSTEKERSISANWSFDANYRRQHGRAAQWEGGVALSGGIAGGQWDDATGIQLYAGRRWLFGDSALGATALAAHHWDNGAPSSQSIGARLLYRSALPFGWRNLLSVQHLHQDSLTNDEQDARVYYLRDALNFGISPVTRGDVHLSLTKNDARASRYSYTTIGAGVGLHRDFPRGVAAGLSFSISRTLFDGASPLVGHRQRDTSTAISATLIKRDWRLLGFAPQLRLTRSVKKSNIAISAHQNHITELSFTKNF